MAELLRRQGYRATGITEIARAAGAPTGSIYHHFKGGKRAVAAAALRSSGTAYYALLPLLLDPHDDLAEGIESAFAEAAEVVESSGWINMCPVGSIAAEVADIEPELREVAAEVMRSWIDDGQRYLVGRGLTHADAAVVIQALLAGLEGAFTMARTLRSREPLLCAGRGLAAWVAHLQAPGRAAAPHQPVPSGGTGATGADRP
jgi:AcrR family transcriptional regulator